MAELSEYEKEFVAEEKLDNACKHIYQLLVGKGYRVSLTRFKGYCSIDYVNPKVDEKIKKLLKEKGVPEGDLSFRSKWSSEGTINIGLEKKLAEDKWYITVDGEIPVPITPDGFRICEIKKLPHIRNLQVTEVHHHRDLGHASVHTHFKGEYDSEDRAVVAKIVADIKSFIDQGKGCQEALTE